MRGIIVLGFAAACGYPPLPGGGGGDGGATDAHHGGDGPASNCLAPSTYGSPSPTAQTSTYYAADSQDAEEYDYAGEIKAGSPGDYVDIALVANTSDIPGNHVTTGTGTLSATPDAATCGLCVVILVKCPDPTAVTPHPAAFYMATAGTLSITSIGTNETGTLTGATLVHVSIDPNNGATAIINDGCTTKLDSVSFTAPIVNG